MELKFLSEGIYVRCVRSNRTFMELKFLSEGIYVRCVRSNRTFMELKCRNLDLQAASRVF